MIGYSSLLIAKNQAFVSFGTLAVFGELTSVVAAVITLPAYLLVRKQMSARKQAQVAALKSAV
jgi:predicted RND superfamily exporter protein